MSGSIMVANAEVQKAELRAVVTRADGTVEDLGVISYYHKNPLKRALWKVQYFLGIRRK
jgi:hypothetical protein